MLSAQNKELLIDLIKKIDEISKKENITITVRTDPHQRCHPDAMIIWFGDKESDTVNMQDGIRFTYSIITES